MSNNMASPASATGNPSESAAKLISLIKPVIAEGLAIQVIHVQGILVENFNEMKVTLDHIKIHVDTIEKQLNDHKISTSEMNIEAIIHNSLTTKKLDQIAIDKLRTPLGNTIRDDPTLVKGLPSNVRMREIGPGKNMFTSDADQDDIDCD